MFAAHVKPMIQVKEGHIFVRFCSHLSAHGSFLLVHLCVASALRRNVFSATIRFSLKQWPCFPARCICLVTWQGLSSVRPPHLAHSRWHLKLLIFGFSVSLDLETLLFLLLWTTRAEPVMWQGRFHKCDFTRGGAIAAEAYFGVKCASQKGIEFWRRVQRS